jgi:hypothetical protein
MDGKSYFTVQSENKEFGPTEVVVDKVGLLEGVDYFFS